MKAQFSTCTVWIFVGLMFSLGCDSKSEPPPIQESENAAPAPAHDPDDIPLTEAQKEALRQGVKDYADALAQIESYRDTIRDAVAAGNPAKAHRPLDELDVVLEHLPTAARDSRVPKTEWEMVNTSAQQLRDSFNKVHAQIDAGEKPDYQAVSANIEEAVTRLDGVTTQEQ